MQYPAISSRQLATPLTPPLKLLQPLCVALSPLLPVSLECYHLCYSDISHSLTSASVGRHVLGCRNSDICLFRFTTS